jgi:hypothetical protein
MTCPDDPSTNRCVYDDAQAGDEFKEATKAYEALSEGTERPFLCVNSRNIIAANGTLVPDFVKLSMALSSLVS